MRAPSVSLGTAAGSLVLLALTLACGGGFRTAPVRDPSQLPDHVRIRLPDGAIRRVALEDYVRGTIVSEATPRMGDRALAVRMLMVQAVVARSYAVAHLSRHAGAGFNLCSTTHCQVYDPGLRRRSRWSAEADEAVERTAGRVLWHGSAVASALFHADCGGHTSADGDVWGGAAHPYLAPVRDDGPAAGAHAGWRLEVDGSKVRSALNADERTRVGRVLGEIRVLERDRAGRAVQVEARGSRTAVIRGETFRAVLSRALGPAAIRSTRFEVTRQGASFVFTGTGFGHGVGLCQAGALARLKAGARPEQVLARYYPGTRLVTLR